MSDIMRFSLFNVSLFNLRRSIQLILIKDSLLLITVGAVGTATFLHHLNLESSSVHGSSSHKFDRSNSSKSSLSIVFSSD